MAAAAAVLWQASGRIGAHRLHPFVAELLDRLGQCGELSLATAVDKLVRQARRATPARVLAPAQAQYPRRVAATTRPSTWLKKQIPLRTFADWDDAWPGFCQVDLVAHWDSSTKGFYLHSCAPWTGPPAGSSCKRSGARGTIAWRPACRPCARGCRWPWRGWIATTARSSSIAPCTAGVLTRQKRSEFDALYHSLNPQPQRDLEAALERLWRLATPDPHRA